MADDHHANAVRAYFIDYMIRKTDQVCAPEAFASGMESQRVFGGAIDREAQLVMEFVRKVERNCSVVTQDCDHVTAHQRVIRYFHLARSRSIDAQNSSELRALTLPDSSSSRRRTASLRLSALASSPLCGGNESRSHAANVPRSRSDIPATAL